MLDLKKKNNVESAGGGFVSGVFVLSLSTLIVKIIGLAFKIPMLHLLGMEGMGYFNSAYEIYALLCVISTAGLPVALSILISTARASENSIEIAKAYKAARRVFLIFGFAGSLAMVLLAKPISLWIDNEDVFYCILAISPALLFICLASAIRGYCQGFEDMKPTAISQLIEALLKLLLGVALAAIGVNRGLPIPAVAALSVLGITVGTLFSFCYLVLARRRHKVESAKIKPDIANYKELIKIALPITLGSAVISLTRIFDMTFIIKRLQDIGVSQFRANEIYGAYTTLALPVFALIPSLIAPISMALIPELAGFIKRNNEAGQVESVEKALRLTSVLAMPASIAVTVFSRQILSLLFRGQNEAIDIAAPLLSLLGASVFFSCLITTTNAILQSYRCVKMPIFSMSVGVAVKAFTTYFLLGTRQFGVYGAPLGSLACNLTVVLINFALILRYVNCADKGITVVKSFVKPFFASVISIGAAYAIFAGILKTGLSELLAFAVTVIVAVLIYCLLVMLLGIMGKDDIRLIPIVRKLIK